MRHRTDGQRSPGPFVHSEKNGATTDLAEDPIDGPQRRSHRVRAPRREGPHVQGDLVGKQDMQGRLIGDRYVRVCREQTADFERAAPGHLVATEEALEARGPAGRAFGKVKRTVIGAPLTTAAGRARAADQTESAGGPLLRRALIRRLRHGGDPARPAPGGVGCAGAQPADRRRRSSPCSSSSASPTGRRSRPTRTAAAPTSSPRTTSASCPRLTAGAALLFGYIVTVAVSIAAGVAALISAVPELSDHRVALGLGFIVLVTLLNLRGIRESGSIFAVPTYLFLVGIIVMIALGLVRAASNGFVAQAPELPAGEVRVGHASGWHPAHPDRLQPRLRRADRRRGDLGRGAGISTAGVEERPRDADLDDRHPGHDVRGDHLPGAPVRHRAPGAGHPDGLRDGRLPDRAAPSSAAAAPAYYYIQFATLAILILAANTAYSDFPRLSYFLARDRYLPRQFTFRGDRLAFSTGIVTLGILSALMLAGFGGETTRMIPLYAVGVFTAFTLSQSGMVVRWLRLKEPGWQGGLAINLVGVVTTGVVAVVVGITNFTEGRLDRDAPDPAPDPDVPGDPPPLRAGRRRAGRADAAGSRARSSTR